MKKTEAVKLVDRIVEVRNGLSNAALDLGLSGDKKRQVELTDLYSKLDQICTDIAAPFAEGR